jgi:hypothetical protein
LLHVKGRVSRKERRHVEDIGFVSRVILILTDTLREIVLWIKLAKHGFQ